MSERREVDRWSEDDYELVLYDRGFEDYLLTATNVLEEEMSVSEDWEALCRRIAQLKNELAAFKGA